MVKCKINDSSFGSIEAKGIKTIEVKDWEEFEEYLNKLESERVNNKCLYNFLYRGQGNHFHALSTTLERRGKPETLSLKKYNDLICRVRPQVEVFPGANWDISAGTSVINKLANDSDTTKLLFAFGSPEFQSTYSYMAHLRHYGFPSPFLDWASSVHIAAFFAFRNASNCERRVSIYVYLESTSEFGVKYNSSNKPLIHKFGPYVKTDQRHFIQQSQYTICIVYENGWWYVPHGEAFDPTNQDQDVLWKFNIPHSERLKVLKILDGYNINSLSLLGSEEGLMETMALREIDLKEKFDI